jgi:hypothetical protein
MALIVEDGTGKVDSESFIAVAGADTRLAALGMTDWAALTTTQKEQALRRATLFMEQRYRSRWKGTRLLRAQALSWPRYGAIVDEFHIESTIVPTEVANACADVALKAVAGDLAPDLERGIVREKIGPLETEFDPYSSQAKRYPAIDQMLAPYLQGGGRSRLMRA